MTNKEKGHVHVRWVHACVNCDCNEVPEDGGCTDDTHYHISFEIPGARKDDINIKITKEFYRLEAPRHDGLLKYISEGVFNCPVKEEEVHATYVAGLLRVTVPYECSDDMKQVEKVPIE
ncbi:MAG: Hsp20/alpha crystallin family protein [Candidatus Odinarchaeota archaeon]